MATTSRQQNRRMNRTGKKLPAIMYCDADAVSALGDGLHQDFIDISSQPALNDAILDGSSKDGANSDNAVKYYYCTSPSPVTMSIRWARKAPEMNGSFSSQEITFEPFVLHIFPTDKFLELIMSSSDGISFAQLSAYLDDTVCSCSQPSSAYNNGKVNFIAALVDLDTAALRVQR